MTSTCVCALPSGLATQLAARMFAVSCVASQGLQSERLPVRPKNLREQQGTKKPGSVQQGCCTSSQSRPAEGGVPSGTIRPRRGRGGRHASLGRPRPKSRNAYSPGHAQNRETRTRPATPKIEKRVLCLPPIEKNVLDLLCPHKKILGLPYPNSKKPPPPATTPTDSNLHYCVLVCGTAFRFLIARTCFCPYNTGSESAVRCRICTVAASQRPNHPRGVPHCPRFPA